MARRKPGRAGLLIGVAGVLAAMGVASPATGQTSPVERLTPLTIPVFDVDMPIGTISARVGQDGDYRIPVASLLPLLQPLYGTSEFGVVAARLRDRVEIGPEEVATLALPIRFDLRRVALVLEIPADVRGRTVLELGAAGRAPEPTRSRRAAEPFSGYLNLNFGMIDDPTLRDGRTRGTVRLEGAMRFAGFVLENSSTIEVGGAPGQMVSRQATRLTRDFPEAGIRMAAGDIFTPSVGFVGSTDILGISAFRNVDVFDPFETSRPIGRQSFALSEPSDVDIYVNGALVRQARLQAGNYDLTNFPQVEGANDVRVEVRNDLGETRTFTFSSFFDANLLAPGVAQWELGAGVLATRFERQVRYDFDDVAMGGFYRRGITNALTLGVNGRYVDGQAVAGVEAIAATPIANISFDLAMSRGSRTTGGAVAVTIQPRLPRSWQQRGRSLDGFVEFATRKFGDNAVTGFGRGFRAGLRYSDMLISDRLSFSATAAYSRVYGSSRDGWAASASLAYRFDYDLILRVTPEYRESSIDEAAASIRISLTKRFGRTSRANASYDTRRNRYLAEYDSRSQYGGIGTLGANVTVAGADNQERIADGYVDYIANRFEAAAGYTQIVSGDRADNLGRTRLNLATAVAFAGSEFAVGRPIQDSFAIVGAHSTLGDRQVVVGPPVIGQGARARSGALGPALLPDLGSYSLARVIYDVVDLPPGYDLGTGTFEFFPPYRAGHSVTVGSNRLASAVGELTDPAGAALSHAVGTVTSTSDREFEPHQVFTNRNGRFGVTGLVPGHAYVLSFPDLGVSAQIEVPADARGFVNVGSIVARGNE